MLFVSNLTVAFTVRERVFSTKRFCHPLAVCPSSQAAANIPFGPPTMSPRRFTVAFLLETSKQRRMLAFLLDTIVRLRS